MYSQNSRYVAYFITNVSKILILTVGVKELRIRKWFHNIVLLPFSNFDEVGSMYSYKGQTNSKLFFQADISSQKQTNECTMIPKCWLSFVRFLEEIEDTKKTFRN